MGGTEQERSVWLSAALLAIATVFMLQATRVFVGYLVFVVDQSERLTLGLTALAVFLAPGLAWLLARASGVSRVLTGSTMLLVVARLGLQFWQDPTGRLVLGAVVIVAWGWLAIVALHELRAGAALGIALALVLDVALRIGAGAIDLPWMPGPGAHVVTSALAVALISAVYGLRSFPQGSTGPALPLIALGPALVLHHLVTGNLALAQVKTSLSFPASWAALAAGLLLGAFALAALPGRQSRMPESVVAILFSGAGLWLFWTTSAPTALWLVLATASVFYLISTVLMSGTTTDRVNTLGRTTATVTIGLVLQVLLLFVYYTFTGWAAMVVVAWLLLALVVLIPAPDSYWTDSSRRTSGIPVEIVGVTLLLVCALQFVFWSEPEAEAASDSEVTVMTYNVQSGFSADNVWSLEETARAIEAEDPDVIVLNEVGRGWLVTSGNDELPWLSRRLDMPYVWGPASDDGLWGNAILSRLPLSDSSVEKFASTQNLKRSATGAWVSVGERGVWVFGTHLDNPTGASEARMEQVSELIAFWDRREPAMILGDFNAAPDDDVLTAFTDQGFVDPGVHLGPGAFTSEDRRRIDYILTSEGIELIDIWIPETWASDHRPVVARVRIADPAFQIGYGSTR